MNEWSISQYQDIPKHLTKGWLHKTSKMALTFMSMSRTLPRVIIVGYARHILGRGAFLVPSIHEQSPKKAHCAKLLKERFVNSHNYSKAMTKFRSKFQFQIPSQFYRAAQKVTKIKLVMAIVKHFDKYHHLFTKEDIMQE